LILTGQTGQKATAPARYWRYPSTHRVRQAQEFRPRTDGQMKPMSGQVQPRVPDPAEPREETVGQRDDRELLELLQELRVAGLGVQVLFGFLLALPFSTRFAHLYVWQRGLYTAILVASSLATALLLGPVAYHRLVFRQRQKEHLVRAANTMAIGGLVAVALAVCGTVLLVISYVDRTVTGIVIGACAAGLFGGLWFVYPLTRRARSE
jgi:hypothetical protein